MSLSKKDGTNNGQNGYELWKSDGTEAGTVMIKDSCEGGCDGVPD